jgi:RND family efflux transporter MFP subunit
MPLKNAPISTLFIVMIGLAAAGACGRGAGPAQGAPGAGGAPPASAVKIVTLQASPIEDASEFIATVRSLGSTTVQPEVEGFITKVLVKAGDRVRQGQPLIQINQARQEASVLNTEANRTGTVADVEYWQQQVKRLSALVDAGAISKQEFDQAQNSLRTAEARLAALDAQVRQGRVELQFYRVTAAQAGVIGDIPVRPGDRVTTSTVLTTIDDNSGIEAYIQVPLDKSPLLRVGLPVRLLDAENKVTATNPITFVAPRVDDATQTVLVKSLLRQLPPSVRLQQFIRAQIVWREVQGLTIPITAVVRVSGQYFCYIAEPGPNGALVARQKPIEVGEVTGNDYVLKSGLKAGDKLIVSGIQKIGDGAPVRAES